MINQMAKKSMSTLILILVLLLVAYMVFNHRPPQISVAELSTWFSVKLNEIASNAEADVSLEKQGHYRHKGMQNFAAIGKITYELVDKQYRRFDIAELNALRLEDIKSTEGYQRLQDWDDKASVQVSLDEVVTSGDGVTSWDDVDEYIDDIPRYYTVTLSGW